MKTKNNNLHKAKKEKNDEFYTHIDDINAELARYDKSLFKGKTVFCNCDDPRGSKFFAHFSSLFEVYGLKKLITTHYDNNGTGTYKLEIDRDINGDGRIDQDDAVETPINGTGDFRSPESIELLKEADIVVSNPPFSLFREYIAQLVEHGKQFLILGNNNAVTYKEIFPLIKDNKMWLGVNSNKTMEFRLPSHYEKWSRIENGVKFGNVPAISWFTNLPHSKRNEAIYLYKEYNATDYPSYNNYDAINVDKVDDIPCDYDGYMGVPITFLTKYNPEQFEIIALGNSRENFTPIKDYLKPIKHLKNGKKANGNAINCVLAIETNEEPQGVTYYTSNNSKYLIAPYARIVIKRRK